MANIITSEQVRAARALLRWEQKDLAEASRVSLPTIKRLEGIAGQLKANDLTIDALIRAFETAGLQFIYPNGGGAGVRWRDNPAKLAPSGAGE
ncbi:helix-turn-helix domain-containing protein [Azospirillum largimobile]